MKKKIVIAGNIVIILLIVIVIWFVLPVSAPKRIRNMVLENVEDYTKTAEIYFEDFQTYDSDISVYSTGETGKIFCYTQNTQDGFHEIELSIAEAESVQAVYNSYLLDKQIWTRIYVYNTFVSFCNENGRESLVYSVNGAKPQYVNTPDDELEHILVFQITDHWYYATGTK